MLLPVLPIKTEPRLGQWLDRLEKRLENLQATLNLAAFNRYAGETVRDTSGHEREYLRLLSNPHHLAIVREWQGRAQDALLRRRLVLFEQAYLEAYSSRQPAISALRDKLAEELRTFQPRLAGQPIARNRLNHLLRTEPNRDCRRQIYQQALRPLAEQLAAPVAELMAQRNRAARGLGYSTFADLRLHLSGIERADLLALLEQLDDLTRQPYRQWLEAARREYGLERVEAWDLQWLSARATQLPDQAFRPAQNLARAYRLLADLGLAKEQLPIKVIERDLPFGGLCFAVHIPDDVRVLYNNNEGYRAGRALCHELGHALHFALNEQASYLLKQDAAPFNEGMAEILAGLSDDPAWLSQTTGLSLAQLTEYQAGQRSARLLRLRSLLAQARFEIAAYDNPSGDLDRLLAEYEAHYLQIPLDLSPRWSAAAFPITHPVYRQNYLLADMIAAQTQATLHDRFGDFGQLDTAGRAAMLEFLRQHYYAPGASLDWQTKIRQTTGQPLSLAALAESLQI